MQENCKKININDYKVFVFDLDNTLYLHTVDMLYREEYNEEVIKFLQYLKENGKRICLATHNKNPFRILDKMEIHPDIFDAIIYQTEPVLSSVDILTYTNKKKMIQNILHITNVSIQEIIFFDDMMYNIEQVKKMGIECIHVCPEIGIIFDNIF